MVAAIMAMTHVHGFAGMVFHIGHIGHGVAMRRIFLCHLYRHCWTWLLQTAAAHGRGETLQGQRGDQQPEQQTDEVAIKDTIHGSMINLDMGGRSSSYVRSASQMIQVPK